MAERPNQNHEQRDILSLGPKFRIDTNNPQMGERGTNVFLQYAVTDDNSRQFSALDESGSFRVHNEKDIDCLLYTSPSPRDWTISRMPSSA